MNLVDPSLMGILAFVLLMLVMYLAIVAGKKMEDKEWRDFIDNL